VVPIKTRVYFCDNCGHLQTAQFEGAATYYDTDYDILIDSEDEDQLLFLENDREVFRFDHQVEIFLKMVDLPKNARVLDFGCAKATTLKKLLNARSDISPFVFDVSEMYRHFWDRFVPRENQATYTLPIEWNESFDVVTSFFSLEHAEDAQAFAKSINLMLKNGGDFYCVVPNWVANIGDIVVIDHPNHFSLESLRALFSLSGFVDIKVRKDIHPGALVMHCRKGDSSAFWLPDGDSIENLEIELSKALKFWETLADDVLSFEEGTSKKKTAIYGSGFYGAFIASLMQDFNLVECFLDKNVFRHKQTMMGKPILPPSELPDKVETIYVALNPLISQKVANDLASIWERDLNFYVPHASNEFQ
jgi:SAM-dependent methyltransferase